MKETAKFRRCPFCGSLDISMMPDRASTNPNWMVFCTECGSGTCGSLLSEALKTWNTRYRVDGASLFASEAISLSATVMGLLPKLPDEQLVRELERRLAGMTVDDERAKLFWERIGSPQTFHEIRDILAEQRKAA